MENSTQTSEYGFIRDGKVYLRSFMDFPERQIGEVKDTDSAALNYFIQRYDIIKKKVENLVNDINEAQNKGSFLMKLLHMREQLSRFDAIGDFKPLFQALDEKEAEIQEIIVKNREKNLQIKRALVQEALLLKDSVDWKDTAEKLKELKAKWLKTGAVEKEFHEETEDQFNDILEHFFQRRKAFFEDRNKLNAEKITHLENIISRAEVLLNSNITFQLDAKIKALQEEWKSAGTIPASRATDLWEQFKKTKDALIKKAKRQKQQRSNNKAPNPFQVNNLKLKQQLVDEAKALASLPGHEAVEKVKGLQARWKDIGPIPDDQKKKVADAFTLACDRVFETSYLMRVVNSKNYGFRSKPPKEQLTFKISVMKDLIRKDESELETFENNFSKTNISDQNQPMNKILFSKLNSQKRKLQVKQLLLSEMQSELSKM